MQRFYTALLYILLPFVFVKLYLKSRQVPAYRQRWKERLGFFDAPDFKQCIWIHAVSVGETQASEPLVKRLIAQYPDLNIVITSTTPTGSDRARKLFGAKVFNVYCPYDLPFAIGLFLKKVNPRFVLLMETEIWPNMLKICEQRHIPTILANARLSRQSTRRYLRFGDFSRQTFARISLIAAQDKKDADRFSELDVSKNKIHITGSIKFDIHLMASLHEKAAVLKRDWQDRPVWVAASTHEGEEEQVLNAHRQVLKSLPNSLLILVPRHPERFDRVGALCKKEKFTLQRRSDHQVCQQQTQVFLGDTMGELTLFMASANAAFVGGSLVNVGGHNVLEPAAFGLPVVSGMYMFNFSAIHELMLAKNASVQINNADQLGEVMARWLSDASERSRIGENGRRVIENNRGALDRLCVLLDPYLS